MRRGSGILMATVCAAMLCTSTVFADLQISLKLEHTSYLQFESINAFVTIVNDTDDLVVLGTENGLQFDKLEFAVKDSKGEIIARSNTNAITSKIRLMPDAKRELMVDITRFYNMVRMGGYIVSAVVDIKGKAIQSNRVAIDVVSGLEIMSVKKSLPNEPDETRKYTLRHWSRERTTSLFLVIDDEANRTNYGIFNLGPFLKFTKPKLEVDRTGKVTVIHEADRDIFAKSVFKVTKDDVTFIDSTSQNADGIPFTIAPAPKEEKPTPPPDGKAEDKKK